MSFKKFNYRIDGILIVIEVECYGVNNEKVSVPLYRHIKGLKDLPKIGTDIKVFDEEIRELLPKTLKGDIISETYKSLNTTLINHIKTYGRLLMADLEMYIGEVILVIISIQKALNTNIFNIDERIALFSLLINTIKSEIDG